LIHSVVLVLFHSYLPNYLITLFLNPSPPPSTFKSATNGRKWPIRRLDITLEEKWIPMPAIALDRSCRSSVTRAGFWSSSGGQNALILSLANIKEYKINSHRRMPNGRIWKAYMHDMWIVIGWWCELLLHVTPVPSLGFGFGLAFFWLLCYWPSPDKSLSILSILTYFYFQAFTMYDYDL
jgi:hypothetical protein